ncbi:MULTISPECIES: hypothetical protein [unclassified Pseudomonas]|uniref:hypothetical protein n=1 Tax=unclassified Pseudomonas TaxID=196821 RepID=UPI0035C099B6
MKKLVPDPPRVVYSYFSVQSDLLPPDALAHTSELLRGLIETLEEHRRLHVGEPGQNMLANVTHAADMACALVEHTLAKLNIEREVSA